MAQFDADVLVIGSGFGGSVAALRAAEAGLRVLVLERGGHLTPDGWERIAADDAPLLRTRHSNGPVALHVGRGLAAATGNAVGGGSNIYTAVTVPPRDEIFETGWPEGIGPAELAGALGRVSQILRPRKLAGASSVRLRLLQQGAQCLQGTAVQLPLSLRDGRDVPRTVAAPEWSGASRELVQWLRGGLNASKRPLSETYLRCAQAQGAEILARHEVCIIEPSHGGYRVHVERDAARRAPIVLTARRVMLAAGTLNTVRLLLHARDITRTLPNLSRRLGEGFFTNGDFGAALLMRPNGAIDDDGPPVSGWIDLWRPHRLFLMELGPAPLVLPGGRRLWLFGVMGDARLPGRLTLDARGRLCHKFSRADYAAFHARVLPLLQRFARSAEARLIPIPRGAFLHAPVTVHPLGGASLGNDERTGVTDPFGEVFGYPGLYICDGSLLPVPIGTAPSMTIAALAEHVMEAAISSGGCG